MKFIKRIILTILILTAATIIFRGWLYRNVITYKSVGQRTNYLVTNDKLIELINTSGEIKSNTGIEEIIAAGLSTTSKQLRFVSNKADCDPNQLINSKTAHCVGYAAFFSTICNSLIEKYKLTDTWIAKPQIGQLYFFGINIHKYFKSSFFKDHDFVIIENKKTGEIYAVDPTVNDYFHIDFITYDK